MHSSSYSTQYSTILHSHTSTVYISPNHYPWSSDYNLLPTKKKDTARPCRSHNSGTNNKGRCLRSSVIELPSIYTCSVHCDVTDTLRKFLSLITAHGTGFNPINCIRNTASAINFLDDLNFGQGFNKSMMDSKSQRLLSQL